MNLPTRSVSAVPQALPHSKRCQLLIKERDEFMAMLKAERDERERRERTSATRIQSLVRGFLVRLPRMRARRAAKEAAKEAQSADELRRQLEALRASTEAKLATESKEDDDMPEWKRELKKREAAREAKRKRQALRFMCALAIQKICRGYLARKAFRIANRMQQEERSVMSIVRMQAIIRGMLARCKRIAGNTRKRIAAAIKIQAFVRRFLTLRHVAEMRAQMAVTLKLNSGARNLQMVWRSHNALLEMRQLRQAASARKIQAVSKGFLVRKEIEKEEQKKQEAIVLIQAAERRHLAKKLVMQRKKETNLQRLIDDRNARRQRGLKAALKIQASFRGHQGRKESKALQQVRVELSTTKIQAAARGRLARKQVAEIKEVTRRNDAAVVVQTGVRGLLARRDVQEKRKERQLELMAESERVEELARRQREAEAMVKREQELQRRSLSAIQVQRIIRGFLARRRVATIRQRRLRDLEEEALAVAGSRRRMRRGGGGSKMSESSASSVGP